MMGNTFSIRLTGPAKVGGKSRAAGATVEVGQTDLDHLIAAGAVSADVAPVQSTLFDGVRVEADAKFRELVEAEARKIAGAAFDGALDQLEADAKSMMASIEELEAEKNALLARAVEAEAQRDMLQARVSELEKQISAASAAEEAGADGQDVPPDGDDAPADPDTPRAEQAAKTTPKKGAAAKPKG